MSNMYGHIIKFSVLGSYNAIFYNKDLEIHFESPFNDDPKPDENIVEIYNLSNDSVNKLKKGDRCTLQAGYTGDFGTLSSGNIRSVTTKREGVDKITTIRFFEGENNSAKEVKTKNKKGEKQISFKAGTTAKIIITRLCGLLGIKPTEISLPKNMVYKKGYIVSGTIEDKLEEVVKDCGASIYYRRGKVVIHSIEKGNDERFTLQETTGLIEPPERFLNDDYKGYKVKCLLQHRIATASIIKIVSSTAKGQYRVKSGKHYYDGNNFLTNCEVI